MRLIAFVLTLCMLSGCTPKEDNIDKHMAFRKTLLEASSCSFETTVTAYISDAVYQFQLTCATDKSSNLTFTVTDPESISGISGIISQDKSAITFDDTVLAFPVLADGQFSPVSGPWIFYSTLCSGYLRGCTKTDDGYLLTVDDSYDENSLRLEIETDPQCVPIRAEIYYQEKLALSLTIRNFSVV